MTLALTAGLTTVSPQASAAPVTPVTYTQAANTAQVTQTAKTAKSSTVRYTTANLHIRSKASGSATSRGVIPKNAQVTVTGKAKGKWTPVKYKKLTGWSSANYLTTKKPQTTKLPSTSKPAAKKPAAKKPAASTTPQISITAPKSGKTASSGKKKYSVKYSKTGRVRVNTSKITAYNPNGDTVAAAASGINLGPGRYTIKTSVTYQPASGQSWGSKRTTTKTTHVTVSSNKTAPSWVRTARGYLNSMGGKNVPIVDFDGWCGSKKVSGCSSDNGYIAINKSFNSMSTSRQKWLIAHEYAHQKQFDVWSKLRKSSTYKTLFRSDPELLANCMASQRGYTNHGAHKQCTTSRLKYSANIWKGVVKN